MGTALRAFAHPTNSRRIRRPHALGDLAAVLPLHDRDVVLALQVEPEPRAVAEVAPEPDRRIGGDRAPRIENIRDAAGRRGRLAERLRALGPNHLQLGTHRPFMKLWSSALPGITPP